MQTSPRRRPGPDLTGLRDAATLGPGLRRGDGVGYSTPNQLYSHVHGMSVSPSASPTSSG
jgi:hypothetical protein